MSVLPRRLVALALSVFSRLLPPHLTTWSRAMLRELEEIPEEGAAMLFGLGCLRGVITLAVEARLSTIWKVARNTVWPAVSSLGGSQPAASIRARPRLSGLVCGGIAVAAGASYMVGAGAPWYYLLVNVLALVLGALAWFALKGGARSPLTGAGPLTVTLSVSLLLTALFGVAIEGASRWITVGPVSLQVSLVVLPLMTVIYARRPNATGTAAMMMAAFAMAVQPDRAMAGVLMTGLLGVFIARGGGLTMLAAAAAVLGFGWSLLTPDRPTPAPFVDQVLYRAFDVSPLVGIAVALGAAALIFPAAAGLRQATDRAPLLAFGGCWSAVIMAAALGNYPTPLVGYGASAVLGYFLSVSLLPSGVRDVRSREAASLMGGDRGSGVTMPKLQTIARCHRVYHSIISLCAHGRRPRPVAEL